MVLFRAQLHSFNLVCGQQAVAKGAYLLPAHRLRQKQPQVATTAALLQVDRNILIRQLSGQMPQASQSLGVVSIEDSEPRLALLVKKICAPG